MKQFKHKGSFEGWLKRITIHTVLEKYRKKSTLEIVRDIPDKIQEEELEVENKTFSVDIVLKFIQQLPDRYRLVFNLYVLDNYTHKEISSLLKISEGTSKSNLFRAKKILRDKIEIHQKKSN